MGLLQEAGIRVPKFRVAETVDEVYQIASSNGFILRLFIPYTPFLF